MANDNNDGNGENSLATPLQRYVAAAAQGLASTAIVHNLSADQVAERAWEIGKKLWAWDMNNGERPQERRGPGR